MRFSSFFLVVGLLALCRGFVGGQESAKILPPRCAAVLCARPLCKPGERMVRPPNQCCSICIPEITTRPPKCALVRCARPLCKPGEKLITRPNECCPVCVPNGLGQCNYNGKVYKDGESFKDDCNTCRCRNGLALCTRMACSPRKGCFYKGKFYKDGQSFKDECNRCNCRGGSVACTKMACTKLEKPGKCPIVRRLSFGVCAELCSNDFDCKGDQKCCSNGCGRQCMKPQGVSTKGCRHNGKFYRDGDKVPSKDPCERCTCRMGEVACRMTRCAYRPCPFGSSFKPPGACCPRCRRDIMMDS